MQLYPSYSHHTLDLHFYGASSQHHHFYVVSSTGIIEHLRFKWATHVYEFDWTNHV